MKIIRLAALLPPGGFLASCSPRTNSTQAEEAALITALEAYKLDTGAFPVGGNAAIIATLKGRSTSSRIYIDLPHNPTNKAGILTDALGCSLPV